MASEISDSLVCVGFERLGVSHITDRRRLWVNRVVLT
jgi:hypothetical protein